MQILTLVSGALNWSVPRLTLKRPLMCHAKLSNFNIYIESTSFHEFQYRFTFVVIDENVNAKLTQDTISSFLCHLPFIQVILISRNLIVKEKNVKNSICLSLDFENFCSRSAEDTSRRRDHWSTAVQWVPCPESLFMGLPISFFSFFFFVDTVESRWSGKQI